MVMAHRFTFRRPVLVHDVHREMLGKISDGLTGVFRETIVWKEFDAAYKVLMQGLAMKEGCFPITEATFATHTIAHTDKMCKISGPLHSFWMSPGEAGNEEIASSIHNRRYPLASAAKNANLNTAGSWLGFLDGSKEVRTVMSINKSVRKARSFGRMYQVQDPRRGHLSFDGFSHGREKSSFVVGRVTFNDLFERIALDNHDNCPYLRSTYLEWRVNELAHRKNYTLTYASACIDDKESSYAGIKTVRACECGNCSGFLDPPVKEEEFIPLSKRGRYLSFPDFLLLTATRAAGLSASCEEIKKSLVKLAKEHKLDIFQGAEIKGILFESTCWQRKGGVAKDASGLEKSIAEGTIKSMISNPKKRNGSVVKMDFFPDGPSHSFLYGVAKYFFWVTVGDLDTEGYVAVEWLNTLEGDSYDSRKDSDGNVQVPLDSLLYKQQWPSVIGFRYICPTGVAVAPGDKNSRTGNIRNVYLIDCHPNKCPPG